MPTDEPVECAACASAQHKMKPNIPASNAFLPQICSNNKERMYHSLISEVRYLIDAAAAPVVPCPLSVRSPMHVRWKGA